MKTKSDEVDAARECEAEVMGDEVRYALSCSPGQGIYTLVCAAATHREWWIDNGLSSDDVGPIRKPRMPSGEQ